MSSPPSLLREDQVFAIDADETPAARRAARRAAMRDFLADYFNETETVCTTSRHPVVRGIVTAASRGITRWHSRWRVRVWVPGQRRKSKGKYVHIGCYPTFGAARKAAAEARAKLLQS